MLELAGIALNLTIGQNGIFSRAQTAANTWRNAETNEQLAMGELEDWMDGYLNGNGGNQGGGSGTGGDYNTATTVVDAIAQNKPFENDTPIDDSSTPANLVMVPAGFKIAQDSATAVEDGIVIEDSDGNQFVWIPVSVLDEKGKKTPIHTSEGDIIIDYTRTAYSTNVATGEIDNGTNSERINHSNSSSYYYTEAMPSEELQSVNDNGGYYIGRFEAGDKESTEAQTMRSSATDATITIKSGQAPYNYITQADAKAKAEGMDDVQEYATATTKLVSSYAWDTAIRFMQITNSDYGDNSPEGNYLTTSFYYDDIEENANIKYEYDAVMVPTGQTAAISNIYDFGGNLTEYTTESERSQAVYRGGSFMDDNNFYSAGSRGSNNGRIRSNYGFRVTLYL